MSGLPPAVASWRDQIERLSEHTSPCRYLAPAKWKAMRENALAFIDEHGAEAHRLGWTAPELFGVHPTSGTLRVGSCGVLMLGPGAAQVVHSQRIAFAETSGYRFLKGHAPVIPIWEFTAAPIAGRKPSHPRLISDVSMIESLFATYREW